MNSSKRVGTLSIRLETLRSCYQGQERVWDIGCDHGHLGISFQNEPSVKSIYFVDSSPDVIQLLTKVVKDSYITKAHILSLKGQDVKIAEKSNCIFIAGMGGKEIGEILTALMPDLSEDSLLVLSPHRKILELRQKLGKWPLILREERVIEENGQFYQILILFKGDRGRRVSAYGEDIWEGEIGERYLEQQLRTYSVHRDQASLSYLNYLKQRNTLKAGNSP
jgi:tRNA (adenine22-N1)-methyltransferase